MAYINLAFLSTTFICIGVLGIIVNRNNLLTILMSLELCLLSVSLNFLIFSVCLDDLVGQVFAIYILVIAACESSVGLAIILINYRLRRSLTLLPMFARLRG